MDKIEQDKSGLLWTKLDFLSYFVMAAPNQGKKKILKSSCPWM